MRFSTRNLRAANIFKVLVPALAILVLGFVVSQYTRKGASAEEANNGKIYYYSKQDVTALAQELGRSEDQIRQAALGQGANCEETTDYLVVATNESLCEDYDLTADNAFRIEKYGYTVLNDTRLFGETELGQSRQQSGDSNPLGYLGAFHVIAFENLDADVQVYGNIATNHLKSASNNNINHFTVPTISYVKSFDDGVHLSSFAPINEGNDTSILVVGSADESSIGFTAGEGGSTWTMNGSDRKVNDSVRLGNGGHFLDNVWVDRNDEFLSLTSMENQAKTTSQTMASYADTLTTDDYNLIKDNEHPELYVHLADSEGLNVLNLTSEDLAPAASGALDIYVSGFTARDDGEGGRENVPATLLLNVDLADLPVDADTGKKVYDQGFGIRICYDDPSDFAITASVEYVDGKYCVRQTYIRDRFEHHVVINYYDSSEPDGIYKGEIHAVEPRGTTQFTLAPGAYVKTHGTPYQGVIIAKDIYLGGDSYYLSLNDLSPVSPDVEYCTLRIEHRRKSTDLVISQHYMAEYTEDCAQNVEHGADKISEIETNYDYDFLGMKYQDGGEDSTIVYRSDDPIESIQTMITNDEEVEPEWMPVTTWNDLPQKTLIFYYDAPLTLTVRHFWSDDTNKENPIIEPWTDSTVYYPGDQYNVADKLLDKDTYDWDSYIVDPSLAPASGLFDTDNLTVDFIYTKPTPGPNRCHYLIHHYKQGTTTSVAPDESSDDVVCDNAPHTVNIAQSALDNGYSFINAYDVTDGSTEITIPYEAHIIDSHVVYTYVLYYDIPYSVTINHYWEGEDEPFDTDNDPGVYYEGESYDVNDYKKTHDELEYETVTVGTDHDSVSGNMPARNVIVDFIYTKPTPEPEYCHFEVHHWNEDGTKEIADAEYSGNIACGEGSNTIDASSELIAGGYEVVNAHFENEDEDIELPYDFTATVANLDYVFNIYYKLPGTPDEPDVPDTSTGNESLAFTLAGASIALGAVLFVRARRQ